MDAFVIVIQGILGKIKNMRVEIVQSENISDLDKLINACIQDRKVDDIKPSSIVLENGKIQYVALIMLGM
ncbi:MAG: hypothetical protein OEM89_05085 [Nitrosopumilus sp.]|nr:hypothetical protein [Nitrosopumilus sp.]